MRKADYNLLALIIKSEIDDLRKFPRLDSDSRIGQCGLIAHNFASKACVNRDEFLKACGIK